MRDVLIALAPATVAGMALFGLKAVFTVLLCVACSVLSEFVFNIICKKEQTVGDLSAAVTGLILGLTLPAKTEIWHCVLGSVFAIIVVKCLFGGLGCNFANPAATARVFLLISFAGSVGGGTDPSTDLVASATPLEMIKLSTEKNISDIKDLPSLLDMLIGYRAGAIGETCAIALIIGGIYLIMRGVIKWHTPVIYIATVFLFSLIISGNVVEALYHVLGGGLLIAAFFMITDYVTSPIGSYGKMLFAFGCGVLTVLLRYFGAYPEGVSFAILIMNILSPYIEKMFVKRPFGKVGK